MELTVQNVYGLILRSRLLRTDEARAMFARWQEEAKDVPATWPSFAAWLVANQYVTEYQATAAGARPRRRLLPQRVQDPRPPGPGRMAGVYKAQHQLGQIVAIKVLPPSKAKDPHLLGRFQREARLAWGSSIPTSSAPSRSARGRRLCTTSSWNTSKAKRSKTCLQRRKKLPPAEAVRLVYQAPARAAAHPRTGPGPPRPQAGQPHARPGRAGPRTAR